MAKHLDSKNFASQNGITAIFQSVRRSTIAQIMVAGILTSRPARADDDATQLAPPAGAAASSTDSLFRRDGSVVRGRITEIVPNDHVTLLLGNGNEVRVPWSEVDRLVPDAPPPLRMPERDWNDKARPPDVVGRPQWRHNRTLVLVGSLGFAAGYAPVVAAALPSASRHALVLVVVMLTFGLACIDNNCPDRGSGALQLLVPVVGPLVFAEKHPRDAAINETGAPLSSTTRGLLYASAGVQTAGLLTMLAGVVFGHYETPSSASKTAARPALTVGPFNAPNSVGLSVGATHW
jgi:hypothetical protein